MQATRDDTPMVFEIGNSLYTKTEIAQIKATKHPTIELKTVLFLGAVTQEKNVREFLNLAEQSFRLGHDWVFIVAGTGPLIQEFESINLPNLKLVGVVRGPDKAKLIDKSMCIVIPDSIGLVAIDAIVHEKLLFTNARANSHGPEYGYLEESGLLRKYNDVTDLIAQLKNFESCSTNPKSLISAPTIEDVTDTYVNACLELIQSHPD
jgi:glycosyltransferase involved in cell wall biosynthesis